MQNKQKLIIVKQMYRKIQYCHDITISRYDLVNLSAHNLFTYMTCIND